MQMKVITVAGLLLAATYICPAQTMDSGTGAPSSSIGNNGDLYHRTDVPSVYGPKASGAWPSTFSYIVGQGCTTAYHIDKDCDGYGVGPTTITTDPNRVFGPDADDSDATVNTPASVLTKYGSINAFLTHLGYPTNRVFYVDPVKGVDASGCGTVTSPCQHFSYSAIGTVLNDGAGGTAMYRASTSAGLQICTGGGCYYPHASSPSSPVVIMAYPGEQVTFFAASPPLNGGGGSYNASTNVIFSGFSLISSNPGHGYGIVGSWVQNITLENSELAGWSMAVQFAAGSQNTTITQNLFHDVSEHAVYPVTGDASQGVRSSGLVNCSTWTWQANNTGYNPHFNFNTTNNIMLYVGAGGYDAIHYNGEICTGLISANILIDGGGTAVGLQDGNQNVTVSNNLLANNSSAQILLYIYGCENNGTAVTSGQLGVSCDPGSSVGTTYYPNMESSNKLINNTIWTGTNAPSSTFCYPGDCNTGSYGIREYDASEGVPGNRWIKYTTIQNNLLVTYDGSGGGTYPQLWFDQNSYPETNTLANNLLWNAYTGNSAAHAMNVTSNSFSCSAAPWYCAGSTTGTYGSGSAYPGIFSFSQFQSYNTGSNTNELWGNPTFADVQTSYSTTPNMFNFRLLSGSPAIGAGLASGAPSTDITGAARASTPSIGAYEYMAVMELTSLACTPALVTAGVSVTCTVSLPQPAGAGGAVIAVSSSSSAVVAPASVTVAAGSSSTTFSVTVGSGGVGQTVVLSAAFNGATGTASLTFASAAATLTSLACSPTTVASGAAATCNLTLSQPAGSGGITVKLSSNMASVTVPTTISVAASSATAQFNATAETVSSTQSATISAQYNGASVSATVSVQPPVLATTTLSSLACTPNSISSGAAATCTVTLSQAAGPGGATVTLSSSAQALAVPASVVVAAGSVSGAFTATAGAISSAQTGGVTATFNGVSQTVSLNLTTASGGIPLPTGTWVNPLTNGFPAQIVGYGKLVYAPALKESVMLENYHEMGSEHNQALLGYNFTANHWDVLSLGGDFHTSTMPDGGHPAGMFTYNPNNNTFVYYCCFSGSNEVEMPLHTWWFDPVGQVGRDKQPPTKPGLTLEAGATFDAAHNTYVLFDVGHTWTYNPTTNGWQQVIPKGTPPPSSAGTYPAMTYDSANQTVYLFGGGGNDIYTYDVPLNTWTLVTPSGTKPSIRDENSFAYDSTNNIFLAFGGRDVNGNSLNDSWVYDPVANTWTQLSPSHSPPAVTGASPFQYLTYDSDDNAFVLTCEGSGGYANGTWTYYAAQTWIFRYAGTGPNPGSTPFTPQPTSGSINNHSNGWANEPVLASNGSALYAGWIETGQPFDTTNATWPHVYVSQMSPTTWNSLGSFYLALDSEMSGDNESHAPSLVMVGSTPWVSWYKYNDPSLPAPPLYAKSWNGSSWVGGVIGPGNTAGDYVTQGYSKLIGIGSTPYIAFLEGDHTLCYPWCNLLYVKSWNGSSWANVGTGPLNKNTNYSSVSSLADSVSITSDGANPIVAWTEYTVPNYYKTDTNPQLYVSEWNGSSWVALGGSLNMSTSVGWAYSASLAYLNGQPYVAWTERSQSGNNQVFVKTWNGSSWSLVGSGTLNKDTNTGWAFKPSLTTDGTNLYLGWVEQQSIGQKAETYVDEWNGSSWVPLGGTLNADPVNGSAEGISLTVLNGQPVGAWGEVSLGSLRQVFVKQWNGSQWTAPSATVPPQLSCDLNSDGKVNILDVQIALNQALGISPCTIASLQQNGQCNVVDVQRVITAALGGACVIGSQ
jgi:hypothetical protein